MKIIVGLGNPGEQYQYTRHNLGWMVVDELIKNLNIKNKNDKLKLKINNKFNAEILETTINNKKVLLVKPQTFMNSSGLAVKKIVKFSDDLWVIHDDLDLELGTVKIVRNRSSAGHKGVQSVIDHLQSQDFIRFRIGIKNNQTKDSKDYVLEKFNPEEKLIIKKVVKETVEKIECLI